MGQIISISKLKKINFKKLKTVLIAGSFDILNVNHVKFLKICKKFGDVLIVGLANDKNIKERKGPFRPIIPARQRAEVVAALQSVDYVFISYLSAYNDKNLKLIKPNIVVIPLEQGKFNRRRKLKESIELKFPLIKVKLVRQVTKIHTTSIIEKILKNYENKKNNFV